MTNGAPGPARANARPSKGLFGIPSGQSTPLQQAIDRAIQEKARALAQTQASIDAILKPRQQRAPLIAPVVRERARAGLSGAADAFTFGGADPAAAAFRAATSGGGSFSRRYANELEKERARDRQDAREYPMSRGVGQAIGTVGAVAGLTAAAPFGAAAGATRATIAATRLASNVGHVARLGAAVGGGGGMAGQLASDALSGRVSAPQTYAGAIVGGALGGASTPFLGAVPAAALSGAATPSVRALLGGTPTSADELSSSITQTALLGKIAGDAALEAFKKQKIQTKGKVGEALSEMDAWLRADPVIGRQKASQLSNGRKTIVDVITKKRLIEAKAGSGAQLSRNQKQAVREQLKRYTVQHWTDEDLRALAAAMATSGSKGSEPDRTHMR